MHLIGDIYPGDFDFTVRGIFDSPRASEMMYFNKEYIERSLPEPRRGNVGIYYILIDNPDNSYAHRQRHRRQFHNSTVQTKTESEQAFTVGFLALLGNVKVFLVGDLRGGDVHHSAGLARTPWRCRCASACAKWAC